MLVENGHLGLRVGIADVETHEESVELRFGQFVGAIEFDGVLRRENDERVGHDAWLPIDGDLMFFHHLEKGGLCLRRRTVDLVGQHDVREDRTVVELEPVFALVVDLHTSDVGWQKIWGELDALQRTVDRFGEGASQRRLANAGDVFDEKMAVSEHAGDREANHVGLAFYHLLDVGDDLVELALEARDLISNRLVLICRHGSFLAEDQPEEGPILPRNRPFHNFT